MRKRALSLLMAVVMVISLLPSVAIPALAADWTSLQGSGTMDDPYQVTDASELQYLNGAPSGVWFKVTQDLTI